MQSQFTAAINQICDEKNLSKEVVMDTVKAALASAYKKDYGHKDQEVRVEIDEESGRIEVFVSKEVVKDLEDNKLQITLPEAKKIKKTAKVGEIVEVLDVPADFGRIAAQTAKQVIIQRIREAERDLVFEEFKDKEGEVVNGVVQRVEGDIVIIDLGKATGILFKNEQVPGEHYYTGQRIKVYVVRVESSSKGPQIVISRSHPDMIRRLFETEVPEILAGTIDIKSIAREAGQRTKIAVATDQEGIDPVGALVGQRGSRVQSVMSEIGEEKIDVILWSEDLKTYISNALSPAKVLEIEADDKDKKAIVKVPEDQLSLAIGKNGQNVRLAAKLTGWNVDISGSDEAGIEQVAMVAQDKKKTKDLEEEIIKTIESQDSDQPNSENVEEVEEKDKNLVEKSNDNLEEKKDTENIKTEETADLSVEQILEEEDKAQE